jgi:amino acid adenylation domain-containing protein
MTLYRFFADTAARQPDAVALEADGRTWTYRELHRLAEAIAGSVPRSHGRTPRRIGLLAARGVQAYAGYLAVLRLGAAVVPLDPRLPERRLRHIAELAGLELVLAAEPADWAPRVLPLPERLVAEDGDLPAYSGRLDDEAYVLFTSGSTGRPKGVPIRHRNFADYVPYCVKAFELGPGCRASQTFGLSFDPSVFDLFVTWAAGATVVAPDPGELLTPVGYIRRARLTHWFAVPSVVGVARQLGNLPAGEADTLRHSLFAAEPLTREFASLWAEVAPASTIGNIYGPTEASITVTGYRLPADRSAWPATSNGTVPIGRPYPHLDAVVLGEDGLPAAAGELCVRGPQRFDGYLDPRDDIGRFTFFDGTGPAADHDGSEPLTDAFWYRTGDRVRWEAGEIVHCGRLDQQVKIRGHRVELGEIEAALRTHPKIDQVVVLAPATDGEPTLTAIYTGGPLPASALRHWLRSRLPIYMLPRHFEHRTTMPLTLNGKIDRRRLTDAGAIDHSVGRRRSDPL